MPNIAQAHWVCTLDGKDLADKLKPRLIKLSITDKSGKEADELNIELSDNDGNLELPKTGKILEVSLGWLRGEGLPIGMVAKGAFKVDEVSYDGPPDIIKIKASSAHFAGSFKTKRNQSFVNISVFNILSIIANRNDLKLLVDDDLKNETLTYVKSNSSDMQVLKDLGERFGAIANVKNKTIIFTDEATAKTPSGKTLPDFAITRKETASFSYTTIDRENYNGVKAEHHDLKTGKKETIEQGIDSSSDKEPLKLKRTYHDKKEATDHAKAAVKKAKGKAHQLELELPYGRPDYITGQHGKVSGFKNIINENKWRISEATHELSPDNGLTTKLTLVGS